VLNFYFLDFICVIYACMVTWLIEMVLTEFFFFPFFSFSFCDICAGGVYIYVRALNLKFLFFYLISIFEEFF
jgi:hypothetical protein